jgi:hypothetical protein
MKPRGRPLAVNCAPGSGRVLTATVTTTELVHSAGSVDDSLFTRIEWMAGGADLHMEILAQGGFGLESVSTTAVDSHRVISRVRFRLHNFGISS